MANPVTHRERALVGRASEIARIGRALDALEAGSGQVLMLTGEPGIGKSTLARCAAQGAEDRGLPVYWGFAWEAGGAPAYWPWTQLLGSLVNDRQPPAPLTANLGQLLPDSDAAMAGAGLQPSQARFQLLEGVRRLLESVSRQTPLVLILEDLHAADSDSLHLLHYVARHAAGMPVLMVGTFRDVEARSRTAGEPLWRTCRDAEVLTLERLHEEDVRDFLAARGQDTATAERVHELFAATEGNPLFLNELVGLLARGTGAATRLPASVQQVIRQQVDLLPPATATLLAKASVLGREFSTEALLGISSGVRQDVEMRLEEALEAALLRRTESGTWRFSHALHRDVLYQNLKAADRAALHLRFGRHLQRLIDQGDRDRWAELAEHLNAAGPDHRRDAIAAWRRAAAREMQRLAFDEAAATLRKALQAFGAGPRADPAARFELLLECAEPALLVGDTESGHRYCRDAFGIARALGDARLMAEAALAWGSAIVVARVDSDLIAALRESLAALPADATAYRARVLARLAGALQPAPNPEEPMDMAREAIELARATGDEEVMHDVLRSAISALMDFAPAEERIPLNEEFAALAARFGDVPGQFRSQLRLMIDTCEAADRARMDRAIEDCHRLAERIGLPHYRWRAASAGAMQATIDGDFARASALLDKAQELADQFDDFEARITLPLQRFAIMIEWEGYRGEPVERIEARLAECYAAGMASAEFFVTPFIALHKAPPDEGGARHMLRDRSMVRRMRRSGDLDTQCRLGDLAALAGDHELARRIFGQLLPFKGRCATLGLMGSACTGPVALTLANLASALGQPAQALELLQQALEVAQSMRSPPWQARVQARMAELAEAAGDDARAGEHRAAAARIRDELGLRPVRAAPAGAQAAPAPTPAEAVALQRDGDLWRVTFGARSAMLPDTKGLSMLARLLEQPETEVHVLDLSGGQAVQGQEDAGPALDARARADYEARLRALREELEEAQDFGDSARADAAREEIDFISRELARAFGLGGRARKAGAAAERARVNVRRRLVDAMERIGEHIPEARKYLENTIKTGTYCRYVPM